MAEDRSFLGTGWGFPPTFDLSTGTVRTISLEEDIRSSLEILLSTEVGERVMQPLYGCDLHRLLFEPLDTTLMTYVKDLIKTAILYFEPRIILDEVRLLEEKSTSDGVPLPPEAWKGRVTIEIEYTIAGTNTRNNFVYPFYLIEGTEVTR